MKNKYLLYLSVLLALAFFVFCIAFLGCAFTPIFHNTAEPELKNLSEALTDMRLEDLFRQHPTLRLLKSTNIGNGNMRHEFSYTTAEKEDKSQRPDYTSGLYLYERQITFSINIFVNESGVIYEVLDPVPTDIKIVPTGEVYKLNQSTPPARDKTRSLPYP